MLPIVGEVFDLANTGLYFYEGDYVNVATSGMSAIPFFGNLVTGGKWVNKGVNGASTASGFAKQVAKHAEKHAGDVAKGLHAKPSTTIGETLGRIKQGLKHPHKNDGTVFKNKKLPLPERPLVLQRNKHLLR